MARTPSNMLPLGTKAPNFKLFDTISGTSVSLNSAKGEKGELLVKFNGSGQNQVTKTITVTANTAKGSEIVRIKAFVQAPEATPAGPVK